MKLRQTAHSPTGDMGNVSVIAFDEADDLFIAEEVTAARGAGIVAGPVARYELPGLGALNFVLQDALCGGVTRSPALRARDKALSSARPELDLLHLGLSAPPRSGNGTA
ncbi:hypothetical protein SAMN05216304_1142 [Bosea sp. OK403]|uniref:AtuA-related protein n=1 Tax=Bosea sp. OK403 TaxID=1855286 RepID=UPI0008E6C619|nr:hypothetical protein [Bosea sp. OK403]SFJ76408.1 hypothetical protein SAMN05216304_1142 [Bosea sp. OK403]